MTPTRADHLDGSIAEQSFTDALDVLADHPPSPARRRISYDYAVPRRRRPSPEPPRAPTSNRSSSPSGSGPLSDALRAMDEGRVSSVELVRASLDAVDRNNDELVAVVHVDADGALDAARRLDAERAAGRVVGPLHGVPITVKDVIDVAGMPTRCASAVYEDWPERDAVSVARLRAAGAVVLGKAATHEFALGVTSPQSRNPRDTTRIPGGSSGGSAASLGAGIGLGSLGTDTRASIRVPAALSGLVGFKPTYGRVPTEGIVSLSWTMDHAAPMAGSVTDAALLLEVLLGDGRPLSRTPASVDGLALGVVRAAYAGADDELSGIVDSAIAALVSLGAASVDAGHPDADDLDLANAAGLVVSRVEAAAAHRSLGLDPERYWEEVGDQLRVARSVAGVDYVDAQRVRGALAERLLAEFDGVDVLVMPTSPVVAPPVDDFARYLMLLSRNAIPFSFVGFPAISVPCGTVGGLPVGLQIVAPPDREDLLVAVGRVLEAHHPPLGPR